MTTNLEYALFSANVYGNSPLVRYEQNTLPIPDGWDPIGTPVILSDGFMARAYQKGSEIVISYAGTTNEDAMDWLTGNVPGASAGYLAPQITDAAKFYLDVVKNNPGVSNISFTGHSMGGGLASLMAVYFDKPAVVFDQAPFQKSADSSTVVSALKNALTAAGYTLPSTFSSYIALDPTGALIPSPTRQARDEQVTQIYTKGEALSLASTTMLNFVSAGLGLISPKLWMLGAGVDKVCGSEIEIDPHAQTVLDWGTTAWGYTVTSGDPVTLHSITLLAGFLQSPDFLSVVRAYPELLPRMFSGLYANDPKNKINANLTDLLVQREYRGEGALGALAVDVNKINRTEGLTSLKDLPGSDSKGMNNVAAILMDAVLANLYAQGKTRAPEQGFVGKFDTLLRSVTGGLTADLQTLNKEADKVEVELNRMLGLLLGDEGNSVPHAHYARWTLQSGANALAADFNADAREDVVIGYNTADTINGGGGDDVLAGLDGADTLNGGAGLDRIYGGEGNDILNGGLCGDWLYGGAGSDTYQLKSGELFDVIQDSDGNGKITVNGTQLTGGKKADDNYWISADKQWGYLLTSGGDLVISKGSSLDTITIRNWQSNGGNQLGIVLDNAQAPVDPKTGIRIFTGDQHAQLNASGYYKWGETSWAADGTLTAGVAEADFADVISGTTGVDKISGLGGNDALNGGAGNDDMDGGSGDDLIGGGGGSDNINGGTGNDIIFSALDLNVPQRIKADDTWKMPAGQTLVIQGSTWGYAVDKTSQSTNYPSYLGPLAQDDAPDVVNAGAGDDTVVTGRGDDRIDGGLGSDSLWGGGGNDIITAGDGGDIIFGDGDASGTWDPALFTSAAEHGNDFLDGGAGDDMIVGGGGNDALYGGVDNDVLFGDNSERGLEEGVHGNDYLDGEDGNDQLMGGGKDDTLYGGAGDDKLWGDSSGQTDAPTYVSLASQGNDYLDGEDGNDYLEGGAKDDTLYGGAGNDQLWGDTSADNVANPADNALLWGNDYLDGEDGNDQLVGGGKDDTLFGGTGDDNLYGDENIAVLQGPYNGNDYLDGEDGNDQLVVAAEFQGNDILDGEDGNDYLDGGGDDTLYGGTGNDTYVVSSLEDTVIELANEGVDTVQSGVSYTLGDNVENLTLVAGAQQGTGNAGINGNAFFSRAVCAHFTVARGTFCFKHTRKVARYLYEDKLTSTPCRYCASSYRKRSKSAELKYPARLPQFTFHALGDVA
nr:hypothetical protein [uncultured Rhodoferax sp.]